jgi:hypothetical protein
VTVTPNTIAAIANPFNETIDLLTAIENIDAVAWKMTTPAEENYPGKGYHYYLYTLKNQPLTSAKRFQGFWVGINKGVTSITLLPPPSAP